MSSTLYRDNPDSQIFPRRRRSKRHHRHISRSFKVDLDVSMTVMVLTDRCGCVDPNDTHGGACLVLAPYCIAL